MGVCIIYDVEAPRRFDAFWTHGMSNAGVQKMKLVTTVAAIAMASSAFAADLAAPQPAPAAPKPFIAWPEPNFDVFGAGFDYAFGVKLQSNYMSRGVSQTANRPGATAYAELRYGWLYAGVQPWNVDLPTRPTAEVDVYAGIRPVWGPLTLDVGVIGYLYPGNSHELQTSAGWSPEGSVPGRSSAIARTIALFNGVP